MTTQGLKISSLIDIRRTIASMCDDKSNGGNNDGFISRGKEKGLYDSAVDSIFGNTFIFKGETYNDNGIVFIESNKEIKVELNDNLVFDYNQYSNESKINSCSDSKADDSIASNVNSVSVLSANGFSDKYDEQILQYSNKYNIDPNMVKAIIMHESSFKKDATSSANCKGLMQVNPRYNSGDLYDVDTNIDSGCRIFKHALDRFGDTRLALSAYNMGEGNVKKGRINSAYENKVLGYYNQLKSSNNFAIMG